MIVHLKARRRGIGTLSEQDLVEVKPIAPRAYLFLPPLILIAILVLDYSAVMAAMAAAAAALAICYARPASRLGARGWVDMVEEIAKQSAQVAVPIIAIGIIIAVAIQSNLALKFSTQLIELSGGTLIGAMLMIIVGCIVMGMGLPTVAAYIIGAILFVPALTKLGVDLLAAHFFVMYYCVLSMITPPVALASYAAAGLAKADSMKTGWIAFKLSLVLFLIPFAFAFDPALLWNGPLGWIALAFLSMMVATFAWAVFLEGYVKSPVGWVERLAVLRRSARHHLRAHRPSVVVGRVRGFRRADGLGAAGAAAHEGAPGVTAKGSISAPESRWLRDETTGARIRQVTSHPSIHHHPFFFVPPWDRAMRRLVFVSHRTGAPQLFAEERESGRLVQLTDRDDLAEWSFFRRTTGGTPSSSPAPLPGASTWRRSPRNG